MKRILLTGGSSGGPVVPLLAVYEQLKDRSEFEFAWLGTYRGPARRLVKSYGLRYKPILSGKLHRYITWRNLVEPFLFIIGFGQSLLFLLRWRPRMVVSAGGFVSVPVVFAAKLLGIPSLVHQQDVLPGLSNKLMAKVARRITVTFPDHIERFPKGKTVVTGNPVRSQIAEVRGQELEVRSKALKHFKLNSNLPVLLVLGGGQGARQINDLVTHSLPELTKSCQIIHVTGNSKQLTTNNLQLTTNDRYRQFEFLGEEMIQALAAADVVTSRAGMSSLSELAVLGKPSVIIPIPDSHQELNAKYLADRDAAMVLNFDYKVGSSEAGEFTETVKGLLESKQKRDLLSRNIQQLMPADAAKRVAEEIIKVIGE